MDQRTDEDIAALVQQGDVESFGVLIERYADRLRRYARRFLFGRDDVEDLVQDILIKAYTNIRSFRTDRRFSPWLYRIAHNEFVNALKRKRREALPFFDADTLFPHPVARETADRELHEKELRAALEHSLGALDPKYREPLVLYYFEEMSYDDIAEVLHIPVATVGVRLNRAKALLRTAKASSELHA